jgi:dolichol-phosphate mannosyltransferase
MLVAWEYAMLIGDKLVGHIVPVRFLLFALIGGLGVFVHLATLWLALLVVSLPFAAAQALATVAAMTSNFALNNVFTYRDRRLRGIRFVRGLFVFYLVCGVGAAANVGVASFIFNTHNPWWLAGLAGVIVGSVWNYALTSVYTWRR